MCPDGKACTTTFSIDGNVITVAVAGATYKATMDADGRPGKIEARINVPGVGEADYVAEYGGYHNGQGLAATGEAVGIVVGELTAAADTGKSRGEGVIDKFHTGAYFPTELKHSVNGTPVLQLEVTEGWPNAFMIFPTPEQLTGG